MPGDAARCVGRIARISPFTGRWARERCWGTRRSPGEVVAELRDYGAKWRAITYSIVGTRTPDAWELSDAGARQVDYRLDEDVTAMGLELAEKLCQRCAEVKALRHLSLRRLIFLGAVAMVTGRDERAQEEFNLGAAA